MSEYNHQSHNASVLMYHLVCPAKYRRVVFDASVDTVLKEVCLEIAKRYAIIFLEIGTDKDHVHSFSDGRRELMHITIAGADDIPIDPPSDLYRNLLAALQRYGDPGLPTRVDRRELVMLVLSAKIRLAADYQWEPVVQQVRDSLLDAFGFQRRALGQPALLCEVISVIQAVPGVAYVDVDSFGGVPERTAEADGTRRLLTLDEISQTVHAIVEPGSTQKL